MSDEEYCKLIKTYNQEALLDLVVSSPELLTDSYYFAFRQVILQRHRELKNES